MHADRLRNAEILYKRGANVNLRNNESKTAIDMSIRKYLDELFMNKITF